MAASASESITVSIGSRTLRERSMLSERLVVIRYSHVMGWDSPRNRSCSVTIFEKTTCTASQASASRPNKARARRKTIGAYRW
jgi:hypothetical protein